MAKSGHPVGAVGAVSASARSIDVSGDVVLQGGLLQRPQPPGERPDRLVARLENDKAGRRRLGHDDAFGDEKREHPPPVQPFFVRADRCDLGPAQRVPAQEVDDIEALGVSLEPDPVLARTPTTAATTPKATTPKSSP